MTVFIRCIESDDKSAALRSAVRDRSSAAFYSLESSKLSEVPSSPFAYWVSQDVRDLFRADRQFERDGRTVRAGLQTSDDFRFVRVSFEVAAKADCWVPLTTGGARQMAYRDLTAVVKWCQDGAEIKAFGEQSYATMRSVDFYFTPGITWPLRGVVFSAQAVPGGSIFSNAGKMAFVPDEIRLAFLALMNSSVFDRLMALFAGKVGGVQYQPGLIRHTPVPELGEADRLALAGLARRAWSSRRLLDTVNEVSHAFVVPAILQVSGESFEERVTTWGRRVADVEAELAQVQGEIDELCFDLYGISEEDQRTMAEGFAAADVTDDDIAAESAEADESVVDLDREGLAAALVSWAVGVAVGRFDVRLATGVREWPAEPDPFDPLPGCSTAVLTGGDGLPVDKPPEGYRVEVSPLLVDDPGDRFDLTARVRAVFEVVFGGDADRWWTDLGTVLSPKGGRLETWLRRGLFDHHLQTYSKSRRRAPVLWPLGTKSGSYRIWLYAHRVTSDSLFLLLTDVVEPKLALEQRRLADLVQELGPSPAASHRKVIDAQQTFVGELQELREEIVAVGPLWAPDLNDGVVIALAPFWRLFAHHRGWSNELKSRWKTLAAGDYDWAQLAMHIWPERVIPKCVQDRSLAIAHSLEDVLWVKDADNPDRWHSRQELTTSIDQLITKRSSPTIQTARDHPQP